MLPYVYSTFCAFSQNKTQITLNLGDIFDKKEKMRDLIMFQMDVGYNEARTNLFNSEDRTNLFKPTLLRIFKNVKIINITNCDYQTFSLYGLLSLLIPLRTLEKVIVTDCYWVGPFWSSSSEIIIEEFNKNKYDSLLFNVPEDLKMLFEPRRSRG